MAKRFTDTEKWRSPFMKTLPAEYRLLWLYIHDDCNHAGIWTLDLEVAELRLGYKLSKEKAMELFKDKIVELENGDKWFVRDFIEIQYGKLNLRNKVHTSVVKILEEYDLMDHVRGMDGPKEKDKDKDKEKDKDKSTPVAEKPQPKELPFQTTANSVRIPTLQEVQEYFIRQGCTDTRLPQRFFSYYDGLGWQKGISPIQKWTSFADAWIRNPMSVDKLARPAPALPAAARLLETRGL